MRIAAWIVATLLFLNLFPKTTTGLSLQAIDEWDALEKSLKTAKSIRPKDGFVPDESTAVKIGEAVAIAQYGEKMIASERPFHARLYGETWVVKGTLHPQGSYGGTAVVKVSKPDGRIVFLIHQE